MRIYIPLTLDDLNSAPILPRAVHAVTSGLAEHFPNEDQEGLEMVATLAAADDSLRLMSADSQNFRRIVAVAEIVDNYVSIPQQRDDVLVTQRNLTDVVAWNRVEALLVDEPGSEELVAQAIAGDEEAFLASGDIELMWYDVIERDAVRRLLGA
ncbi:DUF6912 family protein [Arcanobacterium bovis]|uniref:Uncharacterized protein n=1 Tax=Arcanobacterium bovis TaxID=2529275 RepID=A0A4Q9UZU1_9ACTO|nr:hypothetical protein [Arcanobacterium bovis]TBW21534.1 hypothetical protein EZJ44_06255 [Arcanobacterium bovis]